MKRFLQLTLLTLVCSALWGMAQTVGGLQTNYTVTTTWNAAGGVLTFTSPGGIALPKTNYAGCIRVVPAAVTRSVINSSVPRPVPSTLAANCLRAAQNRTSATISSTPEQRWADQRRPRPPVSKINEGPAWRPEEESRAVSQLNDVQGVRGDALEKATRRKDDQRTWAGHGWHLSGKLNYGKTDLWEESDCLPFIVCVPAGFAVDLYP